MGFNVGFGCDVGVASCSGVEFGVALGCEFAVGFGVE